MLRKPLFWDMFWMIAGIAVLHLMGAFFYLYWIIPSYDVLMHFLGGFWIGFASLWFFFIGEYISPFKTTKRAMLFAAIMSVLVVGLGWEVFEYIIGLTDQSYVDKIDTLSDLCLDTLGGLSAFAYFNYRLKK